MYSVFLVLVMVTAMVISLGVLYKLSTYKPFSRLWSVEVIYPTIFIVSIAVMYVMEKT